MLVLITSSKETLNLEHYTMSHKKEPTCFSVLVKNQWILMQFSQLDLGMNGVHKGVNFANLAYLILLHYLVKV